MYVAEPSARLRCVKVTSGTTIVTYIVVYEVMVVARAMQLLVLKISKVSVGRSKLRSDRGWSWRAEVHHPGAVLAVFTSH